MVAVMVPVVRVGGGANRYGGGSSGGGVGGTAVAEVATTVFERERGGVRVYGKAVRLCTAGTAAGRGAREVG